STASRGDRADELLSQPSSRLGRGLTWLDEDVRRPPAPRTEVLLCVPGPGVEEEFSMTSPIITEATRVLVDRRDLTRIEAAGAMEAIMSGTATDAQIAAFLTALRMKGETVEELIGFAQVMRSKGARVQTGAEETAALSGTDREMLVDTCGTGGDASGTFNVSTATAFVVAGAGLRVAKHGNRSMSGLSGASL